MREIPFVLRLFFAAIGLGLLFGIGCIGWFDALDIGRWARSGSWKPAEATITHSSVYRSTTAGPKKAPIFEANVVYTYTAGGRERRGYSTCFGSRRTFTFLAGLQAGRYTPGDRVEAYFDPAAPGSSVLSRGLSFITWPILFGLANVAWLAVRVAATCLYPSLASPWAPLYCGDLTRADLVAIISLASTLLLFVTCQILPLIVGLFI
jgi:hypothetical protein